VGRGMSGIATAAAGKRLYITTDERR